MKNMDDDLTLDGKTASGMGISPEILSGLRNFPELLLPWYRNNARDLPWRHTRNPYFIWVSEIMLQQTRVAAVLDYYRRFLNAFPDVQTLADAPEELVFSLWQGLGYYSRARNLHRAAKQIAAQKTFPSDYNALLTLPGVGTYTAAAIASAAFGQRCAAVDGNVLRVSARLTASRMNVSRPEIKRLCGEWLNALMPMEDEDIRIFNQAVMELGATVCVPNGEPQCERCPLAQLCAGFRTQSAKTLPVRAEKKARRIEEHTIFVLLREDFPATAPGNAETLSGNAPGNAETLSGNVPGNAEPVPERSGNVSGSDEIVPDEKRICFPGEKRIRAALQKRPEKGLLAGLWEFPNLPGTLDETQLAEVLSQWGLRVVNMYSRLSAKHIFTHVEWHMTGYVLSVAESISPVAESALPVAESALSVAETEISTFQWVNAEELRQYAVPSAFVKYREAALQQMEPE